jgi:NAD(P)-dependent dehydrogenase (short-subunit alcohol dehydrogenase family)
MTKTAIITGAGSGVGRTVTIKLAQQGWNVAALSRRAESVEETAKLSSGGEVLPIGCDVSDAAAVEKSIAQAIQHFGGVHALVNCAGMNVPKRALDVLSIEDFHRVIDSNLSGAFYCVRAVLPTMRKQGEGTIVNVDSEAGLLANPKAGAAYVASKFGLSGLTQVINLEERERGIRACAIFPGDINTPLLDKRPVPPPMELRGKMLQSDDVAECILLMINLPGRAVIEQLLIRPR